MGVIQLDHIQQATGCPMLDWELWKWMDFTILYCCAIGWHSEEDFLKNNVAIAWKFNSKNVLTIDFEEI
jgi:hypothetical protein